MNSTTLLEYWRTQVTDTLRPYLWSDDEAFVFMNEARNQFCRLTEGIPDASTPEVVEVPITTGEITAKTHESILTFRLAVLDSTGVPLDIKNHTEITKWSNTEGSVTTMIVGLERNLVRWDKTPMVDDSVTLLVFRMPLEDVSATDTDLEIDDLHHPSLTYWMSHLAYLKPDTETFDKAASDRARANFENYCRQVAGEQRRYRQKPRAIAYGGI